MATEYSKMTVLPFATGQYTVSFTTILTLRSLLFDWADFLLRQASTIFAANPEEGKSVVRLVEKQTIKRVSIWKISGAGTLYVLSNVNKAADDATKTDITLMYTLAEFATYACPVETGKTNAAVFHNCGANDIVLAADVGNVVVGFEVEYA
jgi:hypothetical protein